MIFNFNGSGSGGNGGLTYNEDTDCYGAINPFTGEWQDVVKAGFQWDGSLYREGNTYSDITGSWQLQKISGTSTLTFNTSDMTVKNSSGKSIVSTNNKIDFSQYTKLHIEGSVNNEGGGKPYLEVGFSTSKNTMETVVYSEVDETTTDTLTISSTVDISAHNSNPLYVQFGVRTQQGYDAFNTYTITNLYFLP